MNQQRILPMIPFIPSDLPLTVFVANNSSTVTGKCQVMADIKFSFYGTYMGDDISTALPIQVVITASVGGFASDTIVNSFYGFVLASTIPSVDIGEMISSGGYVAANTAYADVKVTHNGIGLAPVTQEADRLSITVLALPTN